MKLIQCRFILFVQLILSVTSQQQLSNNATEPIQTQVTNDNEKISSRLMDDDDFPMETQSAQCTITAGEVKASAQATTTKKLEGVCGSKEMRRSFETLEAKILQEIYTIKMMIAQLQNPNLNMRLNNQNQPQPNNDLPLQFRNIVQSSPSNYHFSLPATLNSPVVQPAPENSDFFFPTDNPSSSVVIPILPSTPQPEEKPIQFQKIIQPTKISNRNNFEEKPVPVVPTTKKPQILKTKMLETKFTPKRLSKPANKFSPRDFEVHRFNNTIISNSDTQIFTYFWKIENFTTKLKSNISEISSPIFTISGLHIRVKAILNHLNRDYLYLQLESVPTDVILLEKSPNIILQSGSIFKEIETKKLFRHKIIILDQGSLTQTDMISQEFFNTNSGFMIPSSAITSSSYSKDDIILIKIIIYL